MAVTNLFIDKHKIDFDKALEALKTDLSGLRTGRAQATLVENVLVEAYGSRLPLKQAANISIPDSKSIMIEPWDKSIIKEMEKSLSLSNLGFSIVNSGERLILRVPPMTEENRKDLIKLMGEKIESAKIAIRQVRDRVKEEIISGEKNNEITQDDKFQYLAELDNAVSDFNKKIETMAEEKEEEIMTI